MKIKIHSNTVGKKIFFIAIHFMFLSILGQTSRPSINDFNPKTTFIGDIIEITGANFNQNAQKNSVFFGATKGEVMTASFGKLTVKVPVGATNSPISITNLDNNLTAYSKQTFNGIFCESVVDATTYQDSTPYTLPISYGAYNMEYADLNLDGKAEVISMGTGGVSIAVNNSTPGNLNFTALNIAGGGSSVAIADMDGDGFLDIVTNTRIYPNTTATPGGTLTFGPSITYTQVSSYQITVADINQDGKVDIIGSSNYLKVGLNTSTGPGNFGISTSQVGTTGYQTGNVTGARASDIDGDGKADFFGSVGNSNQGVSFRNITPAGSSTPQFETMETWGSDNPNEAGVGTYPYRLVMTDFDKDGKMDFASPNFNGNTSIAVWRNSSVPGNVSFDLVYNKLSPASNYRIGFGDANGDGYPDIITRSSGSSAFSVYINRSKDVQNSVKFDDRIDYTDNRGGEISGIVVGDMDGDFIPDIALSGTSSRSIRIFVNKSVGTDNTPPNAITRDIIVGLGTDGTVTITPQMVDNGSSDACGLDTLVLDKTVFTCNDVGDNTVTLTVRDRAGNISTATAIVTIKQAAIITQGQSTVCSGGTVELNANEGDSYQWFKNGIAIDGAVNRVYIASVTGAYSVQVTNSGGCSGTSLETQVTVNENPSIEVLPNGTAYLCSGTVELKAAESSLYQWIKDGTDIPDATLRTFKPTTVGNYQVRITDLFGCSAISDIIVVSNDTAPEVGVVHESNNFVSGTTKQVGTISKSSTSTFSYTISNTGLNSLRVSGATFSGTGAEFLSIPNTTFPIDIPQGQSVEITLNIIPTKSGTYQSSMQLVTNDCDEQYIDAVFSYQVPDVSNPTITTLTHNNLTSTTVSLSANVTSDGGATVTSRGFYYGTSPNPSTNLTTVVGTTGIMNASITGLAQNTQYYYNAFATNSNGTTLTSDGTFTTPFAPLVCAEIQNRNNGNNTGVCAGVGGNPVAPNFVNTPYAVIPTTPKTGNITFKWATGTEPLNPPAISNVWIDGFSTNTQVGPASPYSISGQSTLATYCFYGVNLPSRGNYTLEFVDPQTGTVLGRCTFTGSSNVGTDEPPLQTNVAPVITGPSSNTGATATLSMFEGLTSVHNYTANEIVTWSITGGANQALFSIDASTGALTFITAPVFGENNTYEVTITATDEQGAPTSQTLTITILNDLDPTITAITNIVACADQSISNVSFTISDDITTADNLVITAVSNNQNIVTNNSINITGTGGTKNISFTPVTGSSGTVTITISVTDELNQTSTTTFEVVFDIIAPVALAKDITIQLDGNGVATILPSQIDNGSTDNCEIKSISVSPNTFNGTNLANGGLNTVVLTVEDKGGNIATANAVVTIEDLIFPVVSSTDSPNDPSVDNYACDSVHNFIAGPSSCVALVSIAKPIWSDNVGIVSRTQSANNNVALTNLGDIILGNFPVGTTVVTFTATDSSGNTTSCNVTIVVTDTQLPVITNCPTDITVNNQPGSCSTLVNLITPTAGDNCTVSSVTYQTSGATILNGNDFPNVLTLNVGITNIVYTVSDASGNTIQCSYNVTVNDTEKPVVSGTPSNITQSNDAGLNGAVVTWTAPTVTDNCSVSTFVSSHQPGDFFPVGTTTVTYTATDIHGNVITSSFTVTINDTEKPVISGMPSNITQNNDLGVCGATVTWTLPTATDNSGIATFVSSHQPGDVFPVGTTTVTYTATDIHGNVITSSFTVTINDTEKPVVSGTPSNITQSNDAGLNGAVVTWTAPTVTDNCSVSTFVSSHQPGDFFPVGTTTVTYTATDIHGNVITSSFTVTINDTEKPVISGMPSNITQNNDLGACGATVTWTLPTATDNSGIATFVSSHQSGDVFPVGTTTVTYTATDIHGNVITSSFTVTINDTEKPVVESIPAINTINYISNTIQCGATVFWSEPVVSDNCSISSITKTHESGDFFQEGETTVTYTFTDIHGNQTIINMLVIVDSAQLDCDGDGVTNAQEKIDGTNPQDSCSSIPTSITMDVRNDYLDADCDGDGLSNREEIGPNPINPIDSDGDGIADYLEFNNHSNSTDDLEIFNLLTPNGDGDNDVFVIRNIELYPENTLEIYNRWGVKVYDVNGYGQSGRYFIGLSDGRVTVGRSSLLPSGTYFYILRYKSESGVWKDRKGYLYLTR
ncbi:HYR domain-containing protein [Polaribacter gangjinensis]|uniref:HYR domain-containing protein n=1 Tax=Polaribacter gangjinensis TaxID=574710 RepID=UPI001D000D8E|nr:HYR domain-containing protein [Polaribacter gangjinensis]